MTRRAIWWTIPLMLMAMSLFSLATLAQKGAALVRLAMPQNKVAHSLTPARLNFDVAPMTHESVANSSAIQTLVTGAGAAVIPAGTTFSGMTVSRLRFGMGVTLHGDGTADGFFTTTIVGLSVTGAAREIVVQGEAASGSAVQTNGLTSYAGTCTLDLGDGTVTQTGVPYTLTLATLPDGRTSLTLAVAGTSLPAAAITTGSITVR